MYALKIDDWATFLREFKRTNEVIGEMMAEMREFLRNVAS
jgi:hypothetical protein